MPIVELGAKDQDADVRREAMMAFLKIEEPALYFLELDAKDLYPDVDDLIDLIEEDILGIGEPALPLLKKILEDNSLQPRIRTELKKAVSRIESGEY